MDKDGNDINKDTEELEETEEIVDEVDREFLERFALEEASAPEEILQELPLLNRLMFIRTFLGNNLIRMMVSQYQKDPTFGQQWLVAMTAANDILKYLDGDSYFKDLVALDDEDEKTRVLEEQNDLFKNMYFDSLQKYNKQNQIKTIPAEEDGLIFN